MDDSPRSHPLRILIVDDQESILMLLSVYLRGEGHEITTAGAGREALEIFEQGKWDVVLTDGSMPGTNGPELTVALKVIDPEVAVVMMTGSVLPERDLSPELGAPDVVLRKPFKLTGVSEAIREACAAVRRPAMSGDPRG